MNNYIETIDPLLTFSLKRTMICEYFVANISNFFVMLDWPASIILGNF